MDGMVVCLRLFIAYLIFQKIVVREGFPQDKADKFSLYTALWTIIGLRLGHCLFYSWDYFKHHLLEIFIPFVETADGWRFTGFQGLASHGAAIAVILFVFYYTHRHKINILWL